MRNTIITFLLSSISLFGQSIFDQNFESSDYYFNRQLLNPFGMKKFNEITLGFVENIFSNIYLNPAKITELTDRYYSYVDFRGERNENNYYDYVVPLRDVDCPIVTFPSTVIYPNPIPISVNSEPEPKFSIGLITNPINFLSEKFFIGITYQRIIKNDMFNSYDLPYPIPIGDIYASNSVLFSTTQNLSSSQSENRDINELKYRGNIYSAFAGYKIDERLSVGFGFNGMNYRKNGFLDFFNSYRRMDYNNSKSMKYINRNNNYEHQDYTAGVTYAMDEKTKIGIKTGLLTGDVDQFLQNNSLREIQSNIPDVSDYWSIENFYSKTNQMITSKGKIFYSGFDFSRQLNLGFKLFGYFNFASGKLDLSWQRNYADSNYHYSKYNYISPNWLKRLNQNKIFVNFTGNGIDEKTKYSGLVGVKVNLSPKVDFTIGLFYSEEYLEFTSDEKSNSNLSYYSKQEASNQSPSENRGSSTYDRKLETKSKTMNFVYQIPLMFNFKVGEIGEIAVLLNQISSGGRVDREENWILKNQIQKINDSTIYIPDRIEKYKSTYLKRTNYEAQAIAWCKVFISRKINLNLLIDPELLPQINIAQWWISLEGRF